MTRRLALPLVLLALAVSPHSAVGQRLFVGLEGSAPPTKSSNLAGFPNVTWSNHFSFDVSGAAATPEGLLYLCNGSFTTHLYSATLAGSPQHLAVISVDMHALAYGRDTLYGFSNYADPKGIYAIDPGTGQATLVLDVYTGTGFRFFGLDYNPIDDRLYGYTEYGDAGLYRIDIDTGDMVRIVSTIPASNGQGRALAVGNNTVYLTATRGDESIPCFAYDLGQGIGGQWVPFTNPYPTYHSTGGAAWVVEPLSGAGSGNPSLGPGGVRIEAVRPNPSWGSVRVDCSAPRGVPLHLVLFDAAGRPVASLSAPAGSDETRSFDWDGLDGNGRPVPAGVYFVRSLGDGGRGEGVRLIRVR